jgi:hypothetical protein
MSRRLLLVLAIGAALLAPEASLACAVCAGSDMVESRHAFLWTTLLLSVLPPAMVGGLVWWVWRRTRSEREPAVAPVPAWQPVASELYPPH